MVVELD